ncbi:MAG: OmpH family outer membrane protein [Syntrophobacteraceae bacterium]|jgi:outer membrane protein
MKKLFGYVLVAAGITLAFSVNAVAAGGSLKIGFFDVSGATSLSQWGKKLNEELKREKERLGGTVAQKNQAYVSARDEYLKKKDVMDEKARGRKEKELRDMAEELQKLANESESKFNEQANAAMEPLFKKMNEIIQRIAKDEKYDFIMDKRALLFASEKDDLTQRVITELDKTSPK